MVCCGRILKSIILGNVSFLMENMFNVEVAKFEGTEQRLEQCILCPKNTWLTKSEYLDFVLVHLREIITNINDLTVVPELTKKAKGEHRVMFCMLCKCFIEAKARVFGEKCPLGRWQ